MASRPNPAPEFAGCRLEAELGRGGMGVVYRASQLRLRRSVALKVMAPELARDPRFRQRFERESHLAASIDHPHVIPIYEAGEEEGRLYLIMRYVSGPDLGQLIAREGRLDPARTARIVAQVGSALDAAHASGLVHRDIKPANVLLAGSGREEHAYLSDFGLTKRTSSESGLTQTGVFMGTVDYVAPEQVRGDRVDARADVYALAGILFHVLTGHVPFPRDDDMAKLYAHVESPAPRASDYALGLPSQFDEVLGRGLAKDPDARFQSAGDLGRAAQAAVHRQTNREPERSVASGSAAPTALARTDPRPPPPRADEPAPAPRRAHRGRTDATRLLAASERRIHRSSRGRRLAVLLGASALLLVAAAAALLLGGTSDDRAGARRSQGSTGRQESASKGQPASGPAAPAAPRREPLTASSTLTTQGLGPVLAGMSVGRAEEQAGTSLVSDAYQTDEACKYLSPANLAGVSFMVVNREIRRVDVTAPTVATRSGVRVGDTEDRVLTTYGDRVSRHRNLSADGSDLVYEPRDPSDTTRLVFESDGSKVTLIRAGRLPEVEYQEGCV